MSDTAENLNSPGVTAADTQKKTSPLASAVAMSIGLVALAERWKRTMFAVIIGAIIMFLAAAFMGGTTTVQDYSVDPEKAANDRWWKFSPKPEVATIETVNHLGIKPPEIVKYHSSGAYVPAGGGTWRKK